MAQSDSMNCNNHFVIIRIVSVHLNHSWVLFPQKQPMCRDMEYIAMLKLIVMLVMVMYMLHGCWMFQLDFPLRGWKNIVHNLCMLSMEKIAPNRLFDGIIDQFLQDMWTILHPVVWELNSLTIREMQYIRFESKWLGLGPILPS